MSATAALSASTVAQFVAPNGGAFTAMTTALALVVGAVALVAGLGRLGFLANFISEPVLKGFIVGLALTIIMGQLPRCSGSPRAAATSSPSSGTSSPSSATRTARRSPSARCHSRSCSACDASRPWSPPRSSRSRSASSRSTRSPSTTTASRSSATSRAACRTSASPTSTGDLGDLVGRRSASCSSASPRASGRRRRTRAKAHYEIDANRELLGLGAANMASGLVSGMVVNGSLSKTAVNGSAGARSQISGLVVRGADRPDAAVPHRPLRGAARGDARRRRDRRGDRARRRRRARRALSRPHAAPRARLRRGGATGLHRGGRGDARRARLRHAAGAVHRHRDLAAAARLPRRRGRTSPSSAASGGRRASTATSSAIPRTRSRTGSSSCASRAGCSSPTPSTCARSCAATSRATPAPSSSTRRPCPSSTSARRGCSTALAEDLERTASCSSSRATSARCATCCSRADDGHPPVRTFPTVQAAVDAVASGAGWTRDRRPTAGEPRAILPAWVRGYRRAWLRPERRRRHRHLERRHAAGGRLRADRRAAAVAGLIAAPGRSSATRSLGTSRNARRERDHRDLGAVGHRRRAAGRRRRGALRRAVGRVRARRRRGARRRRRAPARARSRTRLEAGHDRLPVRARADDHGRPAPDRPRR